MVQIKFILNSEKLSLAFAFFDCPRLHNLSIDLDVPFVPFVRIDSQFGIVWSQFAPILILKEQFGIVHTGVFTAVLEYTMDLFEIDGW